LGGAGTNTAALAFGGGGPTGATEQYNGTAWSNLPSMTTARTDSSSANAGTQSATLAAGGSTPTASSATESWTGEVATAGSKTLTTS
jgi:hypothetical protein